MMGFGNWQGSADRLRKGHIATSATTDKPAIYTAGGIFLGEADVPLGPIHYSRT